LVSKGNSTRKKNVKENPLPPKDNPKEEWRKENLEPKPRPQKEEVSVEKIINAVTQNVINTLKPDLDIKIQAINESITKVGQDLRKNLINEIQDIRNMIPQQQPQNEEQPEMQNPENYTVPPLQNPSMPMDQQKTPPNYQEMVMEFALRAVDRLFKPAPSALPQMEQTYQQARIRKDMADMAIDDYMMQNLKKKMVQTMLKDTFNEEEYNKVAATADHYMKPLRDVGLNAQKEAQRIALEKMHKQQSNIHEQKKDET